VPRLAADAVGSLVDDKLKILLFRTFWSQDGDGQSAAPPIVAVKGHPTQRSRTDTLPVGHYAPNLISLKNGGQQRGWGDGHRAVLRDTMREASTHAAPAHEMFKNITGTGQAGPAAQ